MWNTGTRRFRDRVVVAFGLTILGTCAIPAFAQSSNVVVQWNRAALQGVRDSKIGPPMVARALFIIHNCIYDAWAAYDHKARGTVLAALSVGQNRSGPQRTRTRRSASQPTARPWICSPVTKQQCLIL